MRENGAAGFDNSMCRCCRVQVIRKNLKLPGGTSRQLHAKGERVKGGLLFLDPAAGHTSWKDTMVGKVPVGLHRTFFILFCCCCCLLSSCVTAHRFPMQSDQGLSYTPRILTMLPQHVDTTPPTCGTRHTQHSLPQLSFRQEGILINLLLSLPFHPSPSVYYTESTAWKADTFPAVVSANQESASGQVNQPALVMWLIFKFGMCSCILVEAVEQRISDYILIAPPPFRITLSDLEFHPSPDCSGVRGGNESSFFPCGDSEVLIDILLFFMEVFFQIFFKKHY